MTRRKVPVSPNCKAERLCWSFSCCDGCCMVGAHKLSCTNCVRAHEESCGPSNTCLIHRDCSFQGGDASLHQKALVGRAENLCKTRTEHLIFFLQLASEEILLQVFICMCKLSTTWISSKESSPVLRTMAAFRLLPWNLWSFCLLELQIAETFCARFLLYPPKKRIVLCFNLGFKLKFLLGQCPC